MACVAGRGARVADQEVRVHPKLVVLGESHALPGDAGQRTPLPGSDAVSPW